MPLRPASLLLGRPRPPTTRVNAPPPAVPKAAPTPRGPSITGVWSGPMTQVSGETPSNIKVSISARNMETEYPELNCTGKLTRIGASKSYVFFVEIITKGHIDKGGRCPDGTITVAREGDDLLLSWFRSVKGQTVVAFGTLKRQNP